MAGLQVSVSKRKVAIVGVGYVGASIAYALSIRNIAREIVLIDRNKQKAQGEARDIQHGIPYMGITSVYVGDYRDCADCDLIIITAGQNRKNGESRPSLVNDNVRIMKEVIRSVKKHYTRGVIMIVSNPVDLLTSKVAEWMDLPNGKVFGTGCILDTSRFIRSVADYISISTEAVKGFIVGEHGDCQIPIWSRLSVAGVPIDEYCQNVGLNWGDTEKNEIASNVKQMGAKIIKDKERTHYGIATCVCSLAEAILNQHHIIASVSTPLQGEYGVEGISMSVTSIIGVNGVEKRLIEHWTDDEISQFQFCAGKLKKYLVTVDI